MLGVFGDPKETGKAVGNDIREGKKTLLLQRAYHSAGPEDQAFLADVCGRDLLPGELKRSQDIIVATGALQYSQTLAKEKIAEASQILRTYSPKTPLAQEAQQILLELAAYIEQRRK
jgi:geranylgeranyl diphosphate synthase type I